MVKKAGWTKQIEKLLRKWDTQITLNEIEYRKRGTFYRKWYFGVGIFLVISQTGAVTTLINIIISILSQQPIGGGDCSQPTAYNPATTIILVIVAVIQTIILIVQGIDKFFNFGAAVEQYYSAANDHVTLSRLIESILSLPKKDRDHAREVIVSIRQQFTNIQNNSPNLPHNVAIRELKCPTETESIPGIRINSDTDVGIAQKQRFKQQLSETRNTMRNDPEKSFMDNFNFQWRRMNEHDEET